MLLWALAACDDPSTTPEDDEMPTFEDEETPTDEDETDAPGETVDASRRDAGARDAQVAVRDAEPPEPVDEEPRDGGRRRDAGGEDAGITDAGTAPPASGDASVPDAPACAATASWDPAWAAFEDEVLRLTNEARAKGHNCDAEGNFGPTTPLVMQANLRCAARLYSKDMADTNNFSHTGKDGSTVSTRIKAAGYTSRRTWGENIAMGQTTAAQVVSGWLDSDGHCRNIMSPAFKEIGVGYFPKKNGNRTSPYWTQNFGG
ncbi:MAG: CAP domain-containing protein [Polyangiales bacterium]